MKISIICPFFNEELIIEKAAYGMISNLEKKSTGLGTSMR